MTSSYGPDRFELAQEKLRLQRLRKKARKRARAALKDDALLDEDQVLEDLDRDRLEEGFRLLGASEADMPEEEEPDEDQLFG